MFLELIFIIATSTVRSTTKKNIKLVVGGQERIDVLSRCLLSLSRWSKRLTGEIRFLVYLSNKQEQKLLSIPILNQLKTIKNEVDSTYFILDILSEPKPDSIVSSIYFFSSSKESFFKLYLFTMISYI